MAECPICEASIHLVDGVVVNELVDCSDCGTVLEVTSLDGPRLAEAPIEDEDWGE